jgi:hypothetical protein
MGICQLKIFVIIIFVIFNSSCSNLEQEELKTIKGLAQWHRVPKRFSFKDWEQNYIVHSFFDLLPFANTSENTINFIISNPYQSRYNYKLDLVSGKLFKKHLNCKHDDIWNKYQGSIHLPPFTRGYIPRLLDQLGAPQEVIVFGNEDRYQKSFSNNKNNESHRIRIIGSTILQYCSSYPCSNRSSWLSKLVLIAVAPEDKNYKGVTNLEEIKKIIDWDYVISFLQNTDGHKVQDKEDLDRPSFRTFGEIDGSKSLSFALEKGHLFTFKELKELKNSCHLLYDYIWDSITKVKDNLTAEEKVDAYVKKLKSSTVIDDEVHSQATKVEKHLKDFSSFFTYMYNNYNEQFYTCSQFVRASNMYENSERHWLFTYLSLYMKMEKIGFSYSCTRKAWLTNPLKNDFTQTFDPIKLRGSCSDQRLDHAFETAISHLNILSNGGKDHFRYIEYDLEEGGTNERIYSWVFDTGKRLRCTDNDLNKYQSMKVFPSDVKWKSFSRMYHLNRNLDDDIIR